MLGRVVCIVIGYLCGCVLFSDIAARIFSGKSAFDMGDGNPGMANVGHELGTKVALVALAGDILKTVLAVGVSHLIFPGLGVSATAWAGLGTTLGHIFPCWHQFKGGKGVTTIASTIVLMHPFWGALTGFVGFLTIVISGYLSVGAVVAMAFYTVAMVFFLVPAPIFVSVVFLGLTIYAHWSKLQGIRTGTTRRAGLSDKLQKLFKRK